LKSCETNYVRPSALWPLSKRRRRTPLSRSVLSLTLCLLTTLASAGCCSSVKPVKVPGKPPERTLILRDNLLTWEMLDDAWVVPFEHMDLLLKDRIQWRTYAETLEKAHGRP